MTGPPPTPPASRRRHPAPTGRGARLNEPKASLVAAGWTDSPTLPRDFHHRWPTLKPPLRPHESVARQIADLLADCADPLLLLGVTPELATIDREIVALDWNAEMIALAWPGDTAARTAQLADWKAMPLPAASVGGAMGDGALSMLGWPREQPTVLAELWRVVRSGGCILLRCFATPHDHPPTEAIAAEAMRGALTFHAFKQRFNMAVAREGEGITVSSARLFERFEQIFPDRAALSDASGWSLDCIAEIDAYAGSGYIHCYPTRAELSALLDVYWPAPFRFVETTGYPSADLCPLLVLERP